MRRSSTRCSLKFLHDYWQESQDLNKFPTLGLYYGPDDDEGVLHVKADTSFGPAHEQFRSVQGVAIYHGSRLLLWTSSRQPFVTLSTAEGELVGYSEAELLLLFNYPTKNILEGDSKAALCQITSDAGSWRTRHLRLRAWKLREVMMGGDSQWTSTHVPGGKLAADGLTKPGAARRRFLSLLGLDEGHGCWIQEEQPRVAMERCVTQTQPDDRVQQVAHLMMGAGVALCAGSQHKEIGTLLILSALVAKWWEGRKNHQDSCKSNQKKYQDPQGNKNQKESGEQEPEGPRRTIGEQEPEGPRRTIGEQEPEGPCRTEENQDPKWTGRNCFDPLNPEAFEGDKGNNGPKCLRPMCYQEGVVRGCAPGGSGCAPRGLNTSSSSSSSVVVTFKHEGGGGSSSSSSSSEVVVVVVE